MAMQATTILPLRAYLICGGILYLKLMQLTQSFIKQSPDLPPFIAFHGGMDDEVNINSADMYFPRVPAMHLKAFVRTIRPSHCL